jgi:hypothetical protein
MAIFKNTPPIITDGLVLYLDAANQQSYTSGSTTWRDISGNNNSGSLINGPTFSSNGGGSIVFDGVNDWVSFPPNSKSLIQGKTNFTIGLTFQSNTNLALRSLFGTLRYGCGGNIGLVSSFNNLTFYNDYGPNPPNGTCYAIGFGNYVTPNTWIHVVGTYDGNNTRIYAIKNNVLSTTNGTAKSGSSNVFDYDLEIGRGGFVQFLTGNIANAFIYNRTITQSEVIQNYNATKQRFNLT